MFFSFFSQLLANAVDLTASAKSAAEKTKGSKKPVLLRLQFFNLQPLQVSCLGTLTLILCSDTGSRVRCCLGQKRRVARASQQTCSGALI